MSINHNAQPHVADSPSARTMWNSLSSDRTTGVDKWKNRVEIGKGREKSGGLPFHARLRKT